MKLETPQVLRFTLDDRTVDARRERMFEATTRSICLAQTGFSRWSIPQPANWSVENLQTPAFSVLRTDAAGVGYAVVDGKLRAVTCEVPRR